MNSHGHNIHDNICYNNTEISGARVYPSNEIPLGELNKAEIIDWMNTLYL